MKMKVLSARTLKRKGYTAIHPHTSGADVADAVIEEFVFAHPDVFARELHTDEVWAPTPIAEVIRTLLSAPDVSAELARQHTESRINKILDGLDLTTHTLSASAQEQFKVLQAEATELNMRDEQDNQREDAAWRREDDEYIIPDEHDFEY